MRRFVKSQVRLTTIELVTILLVALFCAFALVPEVRDWVIEHIQQLAEFVNGGVEQLARMAALLLHSA
jgi:hypothetical protein